MMHHGRVTLTPCSALILPFPNKTACCAHSNHNIHSAVIVSPCCGSYFYFTLAKCPSEKAASGTGLSWLLILEGSVRPLASVTSMLAHHEAEHPNGEHVGEPSGSPCGGWAQRQQEARDQPFRGTTSVTSPSARPRFQLSI